MANTFGILTALVLAFSAFVAFKNKEEFQKQKDETTSQENSKKINTNTFNGLVADIELLDEEKVTARKEEDDFNAKLDAQNTANAKVDADIKSKQKELSDTKEEVANAEEELKEVGDLDQLAPKIERLNASIADLDNEVTVLKTQIDQLTGQKSRTAEALASSKKRLSDITSGRSLPTMKTEIRSIDRRLGIIVLGAGIRSGVIGGSKVAVMRGGEKIGELSVKAVSANLATADVIQSSLKEGESVAVGDTVVPVEEIAAN